MNIKRLIAGTALAVSLSAQATVQMDPPTEIDLHAAYCIGVQEKQIDRFDGPAAASDPLAPATAERAHHRLQRLHLYFDRRAAVIETLKTEPARKRGFDDTQFVLTDPQVKACQHKCSLLPVFLGFEARKQCLKKCDESRFSQIWSCNDLSWLPF
jgi:hypothetical protein